MTIKVMIVDDSAVMRQVLSQTLNEAPDIDVIKVAADPIIALNYLQKGWPDVLILDVEMPRMDGLTFLKHIMQERPTPVVICSSLAQKGCALSLEALSLGAIDIIAKPQGGVKGFLLETKIFFWDTVRAAAHSRVYRPNLNKHSTTNKTPSSRPIKEAIKESPDLVQLSRTTDRIIAIGTSTGGTQALEFILSTIPRTSPGIAVVQHMPEKFTSAFAKRLNSIAKVEVKEASTGDRLIPGRVLIAPGGYHLEVQRSGAQFIARVFRGPAVNRHCPSVDVLFRSVANSAGASAIGIILTGMGCDGAKGLLQMREMGAHTIAQDEASSVVYGMPAEAAKIGAAAEIASLDDIPTLI